MNDVLALCLDLPERRFAAGEDVLHEGARTGMVYVLVEGEVEVLKGDIQVTTCAEPGAFFGEMSALLDAPHTATVRTLTPTSFRVAENAVAFLQSSPQIALAIARLLAKRQQAMTSYLADIKRQFEDQADHMAMVDAVLETLVHHQDQEQIPGSDRDPEPYMD